ncbi:predicted protein [Streptomyces viridochromogenes DSM 40736]|uniref:Predicted protein n=1 Tax=Streptomyces viridochromogenes (strain DSM 40736 / JCM 4977 / BCRC 1201 / Tue 494) TaxID=591159 RepID=D9X8Y6_STRVT|nr:predicted protein [Streptomyces viridochromogenes DSM 40736]
MRWPGIVAALTLLLTAAPAAPAVARDRPRTPVTVPALTDWSPEPGSYAYGRNTRPRYGPCRRGSRPGR